MSQCPDFNELVKFVSNVELDFVTLWEDLVMLNTKPYPDTDWDHQCQLTRILHAVHRLQKEICGSSQKFLTVEYEPEHGYTLLTLRPRSNRTHPVVTFMGHLDTVLSPLDVLTQMEDSVLRGPGALDMKGGLAVAALVMRTLYSGVPDHPVIQFLITHHEEQGHSPIPEIVGDYTGKGGPRISKILSGATPSGKSDIAISFETCSPESEVIVSRKGCIRFALDITGTSGHVGRDDPHVGNAIEQAAKIISHYRRKSTNKRSDLNITATMIEGGLAPNAIPNHCRVILDVRYALARTARDIIDHINDLPYNRQLKFAKTQILLKGPYGENLVYIHSPFLCDLSLSRFLYRIVS